MHSEALYPLISRVSTCNSLPERLNFVLSHTQRRGGGDFLQKFHSTIIPFESMLVIRLALVHQKPSQGIRPRELFRTHFRERDPLNPKWRQEMALSRGGGGKANLISPCDGSKVSCVSETELAYPLQFLSHFPCIVSTIMRSVGGITFVSPPSSSRKSTSLSRLPPRVNGIILLFLAATAKKIHPVFKSA